MGVTAAPATAQDRVVVGLSVEDCEQEPIDRAALAERVAVELSLPATEVSASDVEARTQIRIDAPCGATRAVLTAHVDGREVARNEADLADTTGLARVWALALLAAELVRSSNAAWRPDPPASTTTGPREIVLTPPPPPRDGSPPTLLGFGLAGRLHLEVPTFTPALLVSVTRGWLRVSVAMFAMDVGAASGAITFAGAEASLGARAALFGGITRFGAGIAAHGGVVHAWGRSTDPDRRGSAVTRALGGGSLSLWMAVRVSPALVLDLDLSLGYDVAGPTLQAGPEEVASLHGPRAGLSLAVATPL